MASPPRHPTDIQTLAERALIYTILRQCCSVVRDGALGSAKGFQAEPHPPCL